MHSGPSEPPYKNCLYFWCILTSSTHLHVSIWHSVSKVLEAELTSHEPVIEGVSATAQDLITSSHYASGKIRERREELMDAWSSLTTLAEQRSQMLSDSLEVQQVGRAKVYI